MITDFDKNYKRYRNEMRVQISAMNKFLSRDDVDDIVQSTFLRVLSHPDSIKNNNNISAYLCQAARWEYIDRFRDIKKKREINYPITDDFVERSGISNGYYEDVENIYICLRKILKEPEFLVLIMAANKYRMDEIASAVNVTEPNARLLLFRIRRKIKESGVLSSKFACNI